MSSPDLELRPLHRAFEGALERAFSEVPLEERLEATRKTLEPHGLPEEQVLEAALPGAFHGYIPGRGLRFVRYGKVVLQGYDPPVEWSPQEEWHRGGLVDPLAQAWVCSLPVPFPTPLLEGLNRALELLAEEEGVKPHPLPETTVFLTSPVRAGSLLLAHLGVLEEVGGSHPDLGFWFLFMGRAGALLVDPSESEGKRRVWRLLLEALSGEEEPGYLPRKALATLLEEEGVSGEWVLEALESPEAFSLLKLGYL